MCGATHKYNIYIPNESHPGTALYWPLVMSMNMQRFGYRFRLIVNGGHFFFFWRGWLPWRFAEKSGRSTKSLKGLEPSLGLLFTYARVGDRIIGVLGSSLVG